MASKNKRHVHKYHRVKLSHASVWACALPDCSHHIPVHSEPLINGKKSMCWSCGEDFILTPLNLNMIQPECDNCRLGESEEIPISVSLAEKIKEFTEVK